jgi:hypothetical protein
MGIVNLRRAAFQTTPTPPSQGVEREDVAHFAVKKRAMLRKLFDSRPPPLARRNGALTDIALHTDHTHDA